MICVDFGVAKHVSGGEGLASKVGNPIMDIIVMRWYKASLLAVNVVADFKFRAISIAMVR